jgi:GNAT superfamily N-acetyltransferase
MQAIERVGPADIPHNVALSRSVGWPDVADDWRVLHQAALVLGIRGESGLLAQGALGSYGTAGSIAKMVVAKQAQRQGIGARLLDELLAEAARQSIGVVGLVATPFGEKLYESRGFVPSGDVIVFTGKPAPSSASSAAVPLTDAAIAERIERRYIACSRAPVLSARLGVAIASASLQNAYGMATAHEDHALVGPVFAGTEAEAREVAHAVFSAVNRPVRIDVPGEHVAFRAWLHSLGLRELGARVEMTRGAARSPWQVPERFALIAQAWG